jgi:TonB family protein
MRAFAAALLAACVLCVEASAQEQNPVVEHYRVYREAMAAGDLGRAEPAAAAALEASEARDGAGGRTAVLAFNLAIVRLETNRREAALAPARRAHELANVENGVHPFAAQLILKRAELSLPGTRPADILPLLYDAQTESADLRGYAFDAAIDVGNVMLERDEHEGAQHVWRAATELAGEDDPLAAAHAYIGLGAAFITSTRNDGVYEPRLRSRARFADPRLVVPLDVSAEVAAGQSFIEGARLARPLMNSEMNVATDRALRIYAQAMAWHALLRARTNSQNLTLPSEIADVYLGLAVGDGPGPPCNMRVVAQPRPNFPREAVRRYQIGAVVVLLDVGADGAVTNGQVIASIGTPALQESVERVMHQWRYEEQPGSPQTCVKERTTLTAVVFQYQ